MNTKFIWLLILASPLLFGCEKEEPQTQFEKDLELIEDYVNEQNLNAEQTSSGLHYIISSQGNGSQATLDSNVTVTYKGELLDGTVFDEANTPVTFSLNNLILGWQEGLQLINEGGSIKLIIPSKLGYGNRAIGSIPANSVLIFDLELIEVSSP